MAVLSSSVVLFAINSTAAAIATAAAVALLIVQIRRRPDGYVPAATITSPKYLAAAGLALVLSIGYFTLLFVVPQLLISRADWTKDQAATGQLVAMVCASAATLGFTAVAARLTRTKVRSVLVAAGGARSLLRHPCDPARGILLALFAVTSANATQVAVPTAAVPEKQRPTAIGLFTLLFLLGGAIGPVLASRGCARLSHGEGCLVDVS